MIEFEEYEKQKVKVAEEIKNTIVCVHNILWWIALWLFIIAMNSCDSGEKVVKAVNEVKQLVKEKK